MGSKLLIMKIIWHILNNFLPMKTVYYPRWNYNSLMTLLRIDIVCNRHGRGFLKLPPLRFYLFVDCLYLIPLHSMFLWQIMLVDCSCISIKTKDNVKIIKSRTTLINLVWSFNISISVPYYIRPFLDVLPIKCCIG